MTEQATAHPRSETRWSRARRRFVRGVHLGEGLLMGLFLLLMALIPAIEAVGRRFFNVGIPGAPDFLQHLTLVIAFAGACLAAREGQHLKLAAIHLALPERWRAVADVVTGTVAVCVCFLLAGASLQLIVSEAPPAPEWLRSLAPGFLIQWLEPYGLFDPGSLKKVGGVIPVWIVELIMPLGFCLTGLRFILHTSTRTFARLVMGSGIALAVAIPALLGSTAHLLVWPGMAVLVLAVLAGAPIFVLLGGAALLLFWGDGVPAAAVSAETYRLVTFHAFPAIPIFTLGGFLLSESRADRRLVRVFRAWLGWMPGGTAVAATVLCAFFTAFTGASGVTILALGGLLLPVLLESGFREKFSIGLLTSTGSLGLLFPPSLVLILYAVVAGIPVTDMFVAGIVPGLVLVAAVALFCLREGIKSGAARTPFVWREALASLWGAKWEIALPAIMIGLIFTGNSTVVEAAAFMVVYEVIIEGLVHRDIRLKAILPMIVRCGSLLGGVLIILGVALGLSSYIVDAQIPMLAAEWVQEHIASRWVFLLLLNLALIAVGCLMDIFSALVVVVPLILPMAEVFGIDPVHLGVIFLANLELGYLTPPVGLNLFLASFRFERPLPRVYLSALPFLFVLLAVVLLITFVPWLTLGLLGSGSGVSP